MKIAYTTHRNTNGSSRVKITIEELGRVYAAFCQGARVKGDAALNFDDVIKFLKTSYRYRVQLKCAVPNVTSTFECERNTYAEVLDAVVYAASEGRISISRYRYMHGSRRASHHEYYKQFITPSVHADAVREIPNLLRCVKGSFNDHVRYTKHATIGGTALELLHIAESTTYANYRGGVTQSCATSVYKAAAKEVVAAYLSKHDTAEKITEIRDGVCLVERKNGFHFTLDGKVVAPCDVFLMFRGRVPVMYGDIYTMLAYDMLLDTNKKMLHRIIVNSGNV